MEGHGRSRKVKEGLRWLFLITRLAFQVRKVIGGWVACRFVVSAPVPAPFLWTLDLGFGIWILDLDFGLGFGTWIMEWLDNCIKLTIENIQTLEQWRDSARSSILFKFAKIKVNLLNVNQTKPQATAAVYNHVFRF